MATDNLITFELSQAELTAIDNALTTIENILNPKVIALSPEENQLYGKLGMETENFAKMIFDDVSTNPALKPEHVSKEEWDKDVAARALIAPRLNRVNDLFIKLDQTNRLLGFDIFTAVTASYQYVRYKASTNSPGFNTYYDKWKKQYKKGKGPSDK